MILERRLLGLALVLGILLGAARADGQVITDPSLGLTVVASDLSSPTTLAFVSPNQLLFLERITGRVRLIEDSVLQLTPVLDVNVNAISERGLLGIAVNTQVPPRVFLYYTEALDLDGGTPLGNRLYRYVWNAGTRQLTSPTLLLDLPVGPSPLEAIHNGGIVALGPPGVAPGVGDGALIHVVIGDLDRSGQLQNLASGAPPDDTGVILRIQQNGAAAAGNPLAPFCSNNPMLVCQSDANCGGGTCRLAVGRYYAYGIRNSFGLAVDPVTGLLWDTENGPAEYDEVNRVIPGMNSGWMRISGPVARDPEGLSDLFVIPGSSYQDPALSFFDTIGITAIAFLSGSSLGAPYDGKVLVGDVNQQQLYLLPLNAARTGFDFGPNQFLLDLVVDDAVEDDSLIFGFSFGIVSDMKVGPDRDLYIVSLTQGKIFRVHGVTGVSSLPAASLPLLAALALGVALAARRTAARASGSRA